MRGRRGLLTETLPFLLLATLLFLELLCLFELRHLLPHGLHNGVEVRPAARRERSLLLAKLSPLRSTKDSCRHLDPVPVRHPRVV